ncbi:holliday junction dna helicase ruva : Holliday junction ATP-dependent DNA helicase RuvA OS=Planctomyces limnophilus (strain ATCC 43296 / DSM 3776 / IFAM 1008 / 290) GN=ruvA PE=3 SV=1 [Gemmataceae bacterium]|nr:holliday junction dna helicase ruva : Holliday junction ATP-dependent DNA helicase RuvA OS=Planctomyces limnophilus (strain ATCC 43296 / DSM 3776 / IFAM 1008 / 290) GN=ruvA PE=3 SV=1 [Gemmataceae bacterium]VTU00597.1 holliday junction dna helicase ruva : Holliday junction ATP-dependent DNA helicase RuvA OS=Planctomyces limnophilus (strain ATCC 43296 / DSM 3776 / IFAM 1008 / 290) GN=ruvA PE=3 SV=1 [Gemmataceae bacterium]
MITKMTGVLTRVLDDEVRLQIDAFEYQVLVPESVRRVVQMKVGQEVTFHVTEYLEGNSGGNRFVPRKLGFNTEAELEFFDLFCTVEKIGAKKALKAMARPVREIADAIARQDSRWLSTLPGIGATTAEQIVTTLKRKVTAFVMAASAPAPAPVAAAPPEEPKAKASGRRKPAVPAAEPEPQPVVVSMDTDGQLIEDVYQALMGLGHNPIEARTKLDALLTCGKPFKNISDALTLIYAQKG